MKQASTPGSQGDDEGESLSYLEQMIIRMQAPTRRTSIHHLGHRTVNYMKGKHNFYNLRYDDPGLYPKEMQGDLRFWLWFQAD